MNILDLVDLQFLKELPQKKLKVLGEQPVQGPDAWPYLLTEVNPKEGDTFKEVAQWLGQKGVGLVVNPRETEGADAVISYGMIWYYFTSGNLIKENALLIDQVELTPGVSFPVVDFSQIIPPAAQNVVKQFLSEQGCLNPEICLIEPKPGHYEVLFAAESLNNAQKADWPALAEAIAWFFPRHFGIQVISRKNFSFFQKL